MGYHQPECRLASHPSAQRGLPSKWRSRWCSSCCCVWLTVLHASLLLIVGWQSYTAGQCTPLCCMARTAKGPPPFPALPHFPPPPPFRPSLPAPSAVCLCPYACIMQFVGRFALTLNPAVADGFVKTTTPVTNADLDPLLTMPCLGSATGLCNPPMDTILVLPGSYTRIAFNTGAVTGLYAWHWWVHSSNRVHWRLRVYACMRTNSCGCLACMVCPLSCSVSCLLLYAVSLSDCGMLCQYAVPACPSCALVCTLPMCSATDQVELSQHRLCQHAMPFPRRCCCCCCCCSHLVEHEDNEMMVPFCFGQPGYPDPHNPAALMCPGRHT
jgi:hypothetical protein